MYNTLLLAHTVFNHYFSVLNLLNIDHFDSLAGDTVAISKALYVKYEPFIKEAQTFGRAEKRMENGRKLSATQERLPHSYMYHRGKERQ